MEVIISADNKTVKRLTKLKQKKYRDEWREFKVEGKKNVADTFTACPKLVKLLVLSQSAAEFGSNFSGVPTAVLSDTLFDKVCDTQNTQGVIGVCSVPPAVFPKSNSCILLDRVRDPGNVGTILRTATACGYDVVCNNCADVYSPKVVRSAMSAIVKCNICFDIDPQELKNAGYELIASDMAGKNVFGSTRPDKYCIAVGNEAQGISPEIMALADEVMALPQENMESLNAAVAAAVMMFALKYSRVS